MKTLEEIKNEFGVKPGQTIEERIRKIVQEEINGILSPLKEDIDKIKTIIGGDNGNFNNFEQYYSEVSNGLNSISISRSQWHNETAIRHLVDKMFVDEQRYKYSENSFKVK